MKPDRAVFGARIEVGARGGDHPRMVDGNRRLRGIRPQQLRDDDSLRHQIAQRLSGVQAQLDGLLMDQPRRRILRPSGDKEAVA